MPSIDCGRQHGTLVAHNRLDRHPKNTHRASPSAKVKTMKLTCNTQDLQKAANTAVHLVPARPMSLQHGCLQLRIADKQLLITASDGNMWIRSAIDTEQISAKGEVSVLAKHFCNAVRTCISNTIDIETTDEKLILTAGGAKFEFHIVQGEFPEMPTKGFETTTTSAVAFLDGLSRAIVARGTDESRDLLSCLLMEPKGKGKPGLRLVSTDSYRLAVVDMKDIKLDPMSTSLLVPALVLEHLSRHRGEAEDITIGIGEDSMSFQTGEVTYVTMLREGEYPKYEAMMNAERETHEIKINKGDEVVSAKENLKRAIQQVRVMAGSDTPVRLEVSANQLVMHASSDYGEGHSELEVEYNGPETVVAFNPKYLLDGIDACPGEELSIHIQADLKPSELRNDEHAGFLYLVMPVRIKEEDKKPASGKQTG